MDSTLGSRSDSDSRIFDYAAVNGWAVFTHDLDFGGLLAERKTRVPSVIQVRCQDVLPETIGLIVLQALRAANSHLESGALVTVDETRHRIRILPI